VLSYRVILDVPLPLVVFVSRLLAEHRREIGTRATLHWTRRCSWTCGNATTRRREPGSSTTGCGTWDTGNHPGYALGCWLRDYKEQVFLFIRDFSVDWTSNVSERGAKAAKRHQAVSGYWHSLARWCRIRSYLRFRRRPRHRRARCRAQRHRGKAPMTST
jgi:hypothetical protein